ncbi:MAG: response regulator transcription factor [Isosphaeraceae bacterium]
MPRLRILLADDHAVVREGLKSLLSTQPDMEVVAEAADGPETLAKAQALRPDVLVVDVSMPEMTGTQVAVVLKAQRPELKVLALTVHHDKSYIRSLLEAGASGYLLKRAAAHELVHAIRTVAAGGTYIDPTLAGKMVGSFVRTGRRAEPDRPEPALSDREEEVLRLIARGLSNKEIAARLQVGIKSVESYKARAIQKLGFSGRADIITYALQKGWLQD